jgi:LmbE family N-acetylglucosaminyl deacetylase
VAKREAEVVFRSGIRGHAVVFHAVLVNDHVHPDHLFVRGVVLDCAENHELIVLREREKWTDNQRNQQQQEL